MCDMTMTESGSEEEDANKIKFLVITVVVLVAPTRCGDGVSIPS
jgi:hypothetical protein